MSVYDRERDGAQVLHLAADDRARALILRDGITLNMDVSDAMDLYAHLGTFPRWGGPIWMQDVFDKLGAALGPYADEALSVGPEPEAA